jgi:hypothetical protein
MRGKCINMAEIIRCAGCALTANVTVIRPQGDLPHQIDVNNVNLEEYANGCRLAKERGRAPPVIQDCPYMKRALDAAITEGRL